MTRWFLVLIVASLSSAVVGCGERAGVPESSPVPGGSAPVSTAAGLGPWHGAAPVPVDEDVGRSTQVVFEGDRAAADVIAGRFFVPVPSSDREATSEYLVAPSAVVGSPRFDETGRGAVVVFTPGTTSGGTGRLEWVEHDSDGLLGPPEQTLSDRATWPSYAVDEGGNGALVWSEPRRAGGAVFKGAVRPTGGRFGAVTTLANDGVAPYEGGNGPVGNPLTVAIGPRGSLVVAGARAEGVSAWAGSVAGGIDAAPISVGPGRPAEALTAAIGKGGRAFVAWGSQRSGEDPDSPWLVETTSVARGSRTAGTVTTVERGSKHFPVAFPSLATTRGGGGVLAWSGMRTRTGEEFVQHPVRTASLAADGRVGPVQEIAPNGALVGIASDARGTMILTWATVSDGEVAGIRAETATDAAYLARVRPPGAKDFSPTERVPVPFPADRPIPTFDPTGRPALAVTRPNPSGHRGQSVQLLLRDRP